MANQTIQSKISRGAVKLILMWSVLGWALFFANKLFLALMGIHWAISVLGAASFTYTLLAAYFWISGARGFNDRILDFTCSPLFWTKARLQVGIFMCAITGFFNYKAGGRPLEGHYREFWLLMFFVSMAMLMATNPSADTE